ncbi:cysteine protease StiP family protein [Pantoea sp. FN060301]|uniref:cysteine protease StiP family protein n=1 Tax=Pantoea sp. FN060301 TaxID=3420380 RepID=UPI003D182E04
MQDAEPFHGAYRATDVQFLLKPVALEMTPVEEKERLIQSGVRHYSEMLSQEPAPTAEHLNIFYRSLDDGAPRMAREVVMLAKGLAAEFGDKPVVLVSLVRAGVPLGVMLQRTLSDMGKTSCHYGISIIRDRGIDAAALAWIEQRHGAESIVFVDGWTGKGTITGELVASLRHRAGYGDMPRLVVLADPAGCAWLAASDDDWLIPFGIMGAPVSGLVSRSIWAESGFHGCVLCDHLKEFECSQQLVDTVDDCRRRLNSDEIPAAIPLASQQNDQRDSSLKVVKALCEKYQVSSINRIKPGIAEATRAVLRRVPEHVLVRDKSDANVSLLIHLAAQKGIPVQEVGSAIGQYSAVTIIRKVV